MAEKKVKKAGKKTVAEPGRSQGKKTAEKGKSAKESGAKTGKHKEVKNEKTVQKATRQDQLRAYEVLRYPLITEKAVNMIEAENKLVFVVGGDSTKQDVKKAVESLYAVKVDRINIIRDMKARKRAVVKINKNYKADDVATRLGVL